MKDVLKRKLPAFLLTLTMLVSLMTPFALAAGPEAEKNIYHYGSFTAEKLSNPTTGEREADGLNGDRLNSYAWSMEELDDEFGDYVYIGSNRNILYASATGGLVSTDSGDQMIALINAVTNGELDTSSSPLDLAHAVIVRYNRTTGEVETWFDSADHESYISDSQGGYIFYPDQDYGLVSGFRAAKKFKGALYFNALSSSGGAGASFIYRISSNNQKLPEVVYKHPVGGYMRAMAVSADGNTLYMGGTESVMESAVQNGEWAISIVKSTTGDEGSFERIADKDDFTCYESDEYRSSGGDVWDMVEYNGELYMTIMTMKGAMCFKAHEASEGELANKYGWVWEEFCGEDPESPYGAGFGNPVNYAMTPYIFNGDLYFITFSNAMDAIINAIIGLLGYTNGGGNINDFLDSLELMDTVMENETSVFRMKADGSVEMVVGDPAKCPDSISYVGTMKAGFSDADYSTTNYNWRAAIYNGKFYIGTFDSYPMFKYVTKLTNGDLLNMSSEEFREQLEYVRAFLELMLGGTGNGDANAQETTNAHNNPMNALRDHIIDGVIDSLMDGLVQIQQNLDKAATTEFLNNALLTIPALAQRLNYLNNYLRRLQKLSWIFPRTSKAIGKVAAMVGDLADMLGTVNVDGIERYVRISKVLAANSNPGFELYATEDGLTYETVTLNGFNDEYNYGCRTLLPTDDGLLLGTANPFYGAQLWKITDGDEIPQVDPTPTPSYGSYVTTYNITCCEGVTADRKSASPNTTVTLTVEADFNMPVVADEGGERIEVTKKDGQYTFKMPKSAVVVSLICLSDEHCPLAKFTDMNLNAWYHDGCHYCVEHGIMDGMSETIFAPQDTTTRAMVVTMLWRMVGCPVVNYAMTFKDVPAGAWYTEAVRWAAAEKIVSGYSAESFGANDPITREQLATILYNYAKNESFGFNGTRMFLLDFDDVDQISSWADEAIHWCVMEKIMDGKGNGTLDPKGLATRAEAASMFQRFCNAIDK